MYGSNARRYPNCRWCGRSYTPKRPVYKDGFCCQAHKQAHWRAYKKYVTGKKRSTARAQGRPVTLAGAKRPAAARRKKQKGRLSRHVPAHVADK